MPAGRVIALDLGTGSARAAIFNRAGDMVALATREWSHYPESGVAGSQVFAVDDNWNLLAACIRQVLSDSGTSPDGIDAISATSMREGIVLYDDAGREIWACPNVDARASEQALAMVESGLARQIYDRAGDWVSITTPARLWWIRDNAPDVWGRISGLTMLSDWALYRLSGRSVTEPSAGSSSGMFDLASRSWSSKILEWVGLGSEILPEVVAPGTVIGEVSPTAAVQTGLAPGTPVVAAGADTQLALVGLGATDPATTTVVGGSFWQATSLEKQPTIDREARLRTLCHTEPDTWMIEGIGFYSGIAMRWFRDSFCQKEKVEAERLGESTYALMERLAGSAPVGSGGLVAILSNVMDAKRWVQATPSFLQLSLDPPQPTGKADCIRALQESAAYVTRRHIEIIEEVVGRSFAIIRFTGGASQGAVWSQILADITGRPVHVPAVKESTVVGAAAYAGVGAGWDDRATEMFADASTIERAFEPSESSHRTYEYYYRRWQQLYPRILDIVEDGLLDPLWWPAGVKPPPSMELTR